MRGMRLLRARLAAGLRRVADHLQPLSPPRTLLDPRLARLPLIPGFERLDQRAWESGRVRVAFRATDPVWGVGVDDGGMVPLREHVRRLCVSSHELATFPLAGRWGDVAHNLELAHSVTDIFSETDIDSSAMWCGPAADYEAADSEVAAKHLAAVIVFTLVWTAYECAVETMVSGGGGKGARGRDLVAAVAPPNVPRLRETLLAALELDPGGTHWSSRDSQRLIASASIAGLAGEHLRQFRNRSIHGDLPKPDPTDWGPRSEYSADADPRLRRFHANTRLALLLLQILAASDAGADAELEEGLEDACDADLALLLLHCERSGDVPNADEDELDLGCRPLPVWRPGLWA